MRLLTCLLACISLCTATPLLINSVGDPDFLYDLHNLIARGCGTKGGQLIHPHSFPPYLSLPSYTYSTPTNSPSQLRT